MTSAESNRAIVERYVDAYNDHDRDRLEAVFAPTIEFAGGEASRDEFLAGVDTWWEAFPDITLTPERIVADDGGAAFRFRFEGTHDGEFQGIEPTGDRVDISEMIFFEIGDDRIDGLWFEWDELGFYERLGVLEHPVR